MRFGPAVAVLSSVCCLTAQVPSGAPVVSARGVVNVTSRRPAPSLAAPGSVVEVSGLNIGPAAEVHAEAAWPVQLGGVEVMVNNRPAPVGFVSAGRVLIQIPADIPAGLAQIVVRRGEVVSRPARVQIQPQAPAVVTASGTGFGEALVTGGAITATGLGGTNPRLPDGQAGTAEPRAEAKVWIGGHLVGRSATASSSKPGEFLLPVEPSPSVRQGDVVTVTAAGRAVHRALWGQLAAPEVLYVPFSSDFPLIRSIRSADLLGTLVAASAARGSDGCYRTWLFDMAARSSSTFSECLASANPQVLMPVAAAMESASFGALAGPPAGQAPEPVSSSVRLMLAGANEPVTLELPAPAMNLTANAAGNFVAALGSAGAAEINGLTGEVRRIVPGEGAPAGQAGGGLNPATLAPDLGDGLKHVLSSPAPFGPNQFSVVVGNSESEPTKAKVAIVNQRGELQESIDFPEGWLPLIPPAPPATPGRGPEAPGIPAANQLRFRVPVAFDAPSRTLFVLSTRPGGSGHALSAFTAERPARLVQFPEGWFAAGCAVRLPFFSLELSRGFALFGDRSASLEVKNPCPASGFLVLNPAELKVSAVELPGQGQLNAGAAAEDMNDFLYAPSIDPTRNGRADTIFALDGATGAVYRFDPDASVAAVTGLVPVPELNLLVATGTNRQAGDAGLVVYNLEDITVRTFPVPEGFASLQFVRAFPVARKLLARGNRADGSRLLIYDLISGDVSVVPNPDGVAFFGNPPAQAPGGQPGGPGQPPGPGGNPPGQPQLAAGTGIEPNPKANTVAAIGFSAERRQTGLVVVRIP